MQPGDKDVSLGKIRALLERRNATQPTGIANSGSVFRNPPGDYAGRLIEACGLKGFQRGGALVSHKHANFILNEGEATSRDVESLIVDVATIVEEKMGICLIPEVCIMGRE
jgi:UDP-N-acetylmuramate dehydrogenase